MPNTIEKPNDLLLPVPCGYEYANASRHAPPFCFVRARYLTRNLTNFDRSRMNFSHGYTIRLGQGLATASAHRVTIGSRPKASTKGLVVESLPDLSWTARPAQNQSRGLANWLKFYRREEQN